MTDVITTLFKGTESWIQSCFQHHFEVSASFVVWMITRGRPRAQLYLNPSHGSKINYRHGFLCPVRNHVLFHGNGSTWRQTVEGIAGKSEKGKFFYYLYDVWPCYKLLLTELVRMMDWTLLQNLLPVTLASIGVFGPAQIINFRLARSPYISQDWPLTQGPIILVVIVTSFMPLYARPPFLNCVSLGYNCFLATVNQTNNTTIEVES